MLLILTGLLGCNALAPRTPLPFQTLIQRDFPSSPNIKARLELAATAREGDNLAYSIRDVPATVTDSLRQLDYNRSFALLVVRESVGTSGSRITVDEITRQGDQVTVRVRLDSPAPDTIQLQSFMAPYHLLTVSKVGTWGLPIHFRVLAEGEVIAEATHIIP
jgi:hypothetical protein